MPTLVLKALQHRVQRALPADLPGLSLPDTRSLLTTSHHKYVTSTILVRHEHLPRFGRWQSSFRVVPATHCLSQPLSRLEFGFEGFTLAARPPPEEWNLPPHPICPSTQYLITVAEHASPTDRLRGCFLTLSTNGPSYSCVRGGLGRLHHIPPVGLVPLYTFADLLRRWYKSVGPGRGADIQRT